MAKPLPRRRPKAFPVGHRFCPRFSRFLIALIFRQVIPALFLGVWLGGSLAYGLSLSSLWDGLMDTVPVHVSGRAQRLGAISRSFSSHS